MVVDPVHFLYLVWSSQMYVRDRGKSYVHLFNWFSPKKGYPGESAEPMKEGKQGPGHPTVNFGALSSLFLRCYWSPAFSSHQDDVRIIVTSHGQSCTSLRLFWGEIWCVSGGGGQGGS